MKSVLTGVLLAVAMMASCSEPQCGDNERLIGNTCRKLPTRDGGGDTDDEPGASTASDAAVRADATSDAAEGAPVDATTAAQDANSALPEEAAVVDAGPALPACGDGILNGTELCDPKIAAGLPGACMTNEACKSTDACLDARLVGEPAACNVRCETSPKRECKNDDQCCPSGCTSQNDNSCSASCGNGFVDANESCESNVGAGCPSACPAPTGCNAYMLTGDAKACSAKCTPVTISAPQQGDGCCPAGATPTADHDCAGCGNGKKESGETCDGDCPSSCADDGDPCTIDGPTGNAAECNVACPSVRPKKPKSSVVDSCCPKAYDSSANNTNDPDCAPSCGNNVKEPGELCDGADCPTSCPPDGNPCTSDAVQGTGCARTCSYPAITAAANDGCCLPGETYPGEQSCAGCGNGKVEAGEQCDDGNKTDNDGCSATCQWQDIIGNGSWGDERPGFFYCGGTSCNASQMCRVSYSTFPPTYLCGDPTNVGTRSQCDGPEDCPPGHSCVGASGEDETVVGCEPTSNLGADAYIYCHKDADCVAPKRCGVNGPGGGDAKFPGTAWCGPLG